MRGAFKHKKCILERKVFARLGVLIFTSDARPTIFHTVQRAQRRKTATLQVRLGVLCCVGAGIVECLKEWRCMVVGLEVCGGRGGDVWEEWRCVEGVEVCGRGEGVWELSNEVCGRGGGVWEGWKSVVGGVEVCGRGKVCGGMDGGECGRGVGVWWEG